MIGSSQLFFNILDDNDNWISFPFIYIYEKLSLNYFILFIYEKFITNSILSTNGNHN